MPTYRLTMLRSRSYTGGSAEVAALSFAIAATAACVESFGRGTTAFRTTGSPDQPGYWRCYQPRADGRPVAVGRPFKLEETP